MPTLAEPKTLRAALYVRVSSPGQEQDGTSLDTQEERCRQYAAEHDYQIAAEHSYREVYVGTELWDRPQLSRLRDAVRRRDIDAVVAHSIDRLTRDPVHLGVLISEAEHAGVDVQFVLDDIDHTPRGP